MLVSHRITGTVELIPKHPGSHERVLQMQLINAAHQFQIAGKHWRGLIIDAAVADADQLRLTLDGKGMATVDYRFALSNSALVSALSKNRSPASTAGHNIRLLFNKLRKRLFLLFAGLLLALCCRSDWQDTTVLVGSVLAE